ncbi:hypothetical protein CK203_034108 [Vitis vinifera]|uniref:Uncharacterized protein n=1 Tax=Vitis vinifera TaxID=29760 RepID=A0A438IBC9_VITVI|nr:hypothetical protein CK203_034108 [Vitis vinifera]
MEQVVRALRANPLLVTALVAITLVCFVHPALGLFILLFSHALCCHNALCGEAKEGLTMKWRGGRPQSGSALTHSFVGG